MNSNKLEMVKCEDLQINVPNNNHTNKSVNFPVTVCIQTVCALRLRCIVVASFLIWWWKPQNSADFDKRKPFYQVVHFEVLCTYYVENLEMDNSLKWVLFIKVGGQMTSDTLWK